MKWWDQIRWPLYLLLWAGILQKKWSSHHGRQKSPKCSTWMQSQNNRMISFRFQGKPFNITVIQVYAPTSNAGSCQSEAIKYPIHQPGVVCLFLQSLHTLHFGGHFHLGCSGVCKPILEDGFVIPWKTSKSGWRKNQTLRPHAATTLLCNFVFN